MKRLTILLSLMLFATACHRKGVALKPTPLPPPSTVPGLPVEPAVRFFDQANLAFDAGRYYEAAQSYEAYLQRETAGTHRDEALFREALSYGLLSNPDWSRVTTLLKQLVDRHPQSPLRAAATLILSLQSDTQKRDQRIKQLTTELDKLKQIDAERRKRP